MLTNPFCQVFISIYFANLFAEMVAVYMFFYRVFQDSTLSCLKHDQMFCLLPKKIV